MPLISIWREGYSVTGNSGKAEFVGEVTAYSFEEACELLSKDERTGIKKGTHGYHIWGCRLFETEQEARKSFG